MKKIILWILFVWGGIIIPKQVLCSTLYWDLERSPDELKTNMSFEIHLYIDTEGESINAFEGEIEYSPQSLELKNANTANSIINFWIVPPTQKLTPGSEMKILFFSGITPLGINTKKGKLLSLEFQSEKIGDSPLIIKNLKLLKNDGLGTEINATIKPFLINIPSRGETQKEKQEKENFLKEEEISIEIFKSELLKNENYLIIHAQPKYYGIKKYEIKETKDKKEEKTKKWKEISLPYRLEDQSQKSQIEIKITDTNGNERMEILNKRIDSQKIEIQNQDKFLLLIAICGLFLLLVLRKKKRKRKTKK